MAAAGARAAETPDRPETGGAHGHVAVVYFHGMGEQRRFEEVSRLIDALDSYVGGRRRDGDRSVGYLSNIKPRSEEWGPDLPGDEDEAHANYIRAYYSTPGKQAVSQTVRFYEVYWAPILAEQVSPATVLRWVFATAIRPLSTFGTPWRERQRLRRAALIRLMDRSPKETERDFFKLTSLYDTFEGPRARRDFPDGTFEDFLKFVQAKNSRRPETSERLTGLLRDWRRTCYAREIRSFFLLLTLALGVLLLGGLSLAFVLFLLQLVVPLSGWLGSLGLEAAAKQLAPSWPNAITLGIAAAGMLGLSRFVTRYLGDVQQWTTYEETDTKHRRRREILDRAARVLRHVLASDACERVVVVGHSLGSAIAHDVMLELARHNRATNAQDPFAGPIDFGKLEHLVTLGSPIDKIHYLFESTRSRYHRFNRVVNDLRGDVGTPPFSRNRKPHIHWINFWDAGDPISGPLYSPTNARNLKAGVDNVQISSFGYPRPAAAHSAYFEHREFMSSLFDVILLGKYRFRDAPRPDGNERDYASMEIGPGEASSATRRWLAGLVALPWSIVAAFAVSSFTTSWVSTAAWAWVASLAGALAAGWLVSAARGHRNPFER